MAKIIVSCRFQKSAKDMADLIRYMATREGVEKLPDAKKYRIATQKQHDLILSVVKHFPQSKKFLEYDDYYAMPTRKNANEFLDAVAERYSDRSDELQQQKGKKLYGYLPRKMKRLVDFAMHEFAKNSGLAEIYSKWNEVNREKLNLSKNC